MRRAAFACLLLCSAAFAQSTPPANDSVYQAWGGKAGIRAVMDDFVPRLIADPRTAPFFKDANQPHIKSQLVDQICELSGGPCKLKGPDMKKVHAGVDIDKAAFHALVEVLQHSMDAQGIAFSTQNRLLAKLAPMHREIVNVP